ncbi:MAG: putative glycoside hydrolase [Gammaproteobacteria bacterium]
MRISTLVVLLLLGWFAAGTNSLADSRSPEGQVRYLQEAESKFDMYTRRPSKKEAAWMRDHYWRMMVYSPYFDSRLSWSPPAWDYEDAYAIKSHWDEFDDHPEWILRDGGGNLLYIPWGCKNDTCPQYAADVGNPEFRAHWIRKVRETIEKGYVGLWIDDVNLAWRVSDNFGDKVIPIDPRTGKEMRIEDWRRYFAEFMEEVRAALPDAEIAHNAIWYAGSTDDPIIRRQILAADYFNIERGANDNGLKGGGGKYGFETWLDFIDRIHAMDRNVILMDKGKSKLERNYGLAAYFLVNDGADLMNSSRVEFTAPDQWWEGYSLNLGAALGPRYKAKGVLQRDFECGKVLLNQPGMNMRTVDLEEGYSFMSGKKVRAVTMPKKTAAILLKSCATYQGQP